MKIRIWGARGSLPTSMDAKTLQDKLVAALLAANGKQLDSADKARAFVLNDLDFAVSHTFGGNSPCVQIDTGDDDLLLCDLGSGARAFAQHVIRTHGHTRTHTYHFVMSHMHWDHIMGLLLFTPLYIPGNRVVIYGCHAELEAAFRRQHAAPCFPVEFDQLAAKIEFVTLRPGEASQICGFKVLAMRQAHGGDSYCYRFERDGKIFIYATDCEHKLEDAQETGRFVDFFRDADLVMFDAMYSLLDSVSVKADWGHSSNVVGVELAQLAQAKRLCLFHHEPMFSDEELLQIWRETMRLEEITRPGLPLQILSAYDGLEIAL